MLRLWRIGSTEAKRGVRRSRYIHSHTERTEGDKWIQTCGDNFYARLRTGSLNLGAICDKATKLKLNSPDMRPWDRIPKLLYVENWFSFVEFETPLALGLY